MKNFLAFFIIFFGFYGALSALTSEQRFEAAQQKYPGIVKFNASLHLASTKEESVERPTKKIKLESFIYIESAALTAQKPALENFFTKNLDAHLIIDFARGDGFVDETGTISGIKKESIPPSLQKLIISNVQGDITAIGNGALSKCRGLRCIDFSALSKVIRIGDYFLSECSSLEAINLSPLSGVTSIGDGFLSRCSGLKAIDLSALSKVTSIGDGFFYDCSGLKRIDLSPLSGVTSIGDGFLSGCSDLEIIDLSSFAHVTSIGNGFLSCCSDLTNINLSPLSGVTCIGDFFLSWCDSLTCIDFSPLLSVIRIGDWFISDCSFLQSIIGLDDGFMERLDEASRKSVIGPLRESNVPALQALGQIFYMKYIYKPDPALEAALKSWNFDTFKVITPKRLDDIESMTGDHVLAIFDDVITKVSPMLEKEVIPNYALHLRPILEFLYGADVPITWAMYEEEKPHMAIVFKHIAKKLHASKIEEQATIMLQLLEALAHCQSRQSAIVNSVAAKMGLLPYVTDRGRLNDLYDMINTFKLAQFNEAVGTIQALGDTHHYMRYFTALDGKLGIPAALHMQEKISFLSDEDINEIWSEFFRLFFTPAILVDYAVKIIAEANITEEKQLDPDNKRSYMNVRFELWEATAKTIKDRYLKNGEHDIAAYFKALNKNENFDHHEAPITQAEAKRLLVLMQILKIDPQEEGLMEN